MKKIAIIGGARPNFMKIAPLARELKKNSANYFVVNTGQHFDSQMSTDFIKEFGLKIDDELNPPNTGAIKQMAHIIIELEKIFLRKKPDIAVVVGDVNSTLAASLVANKLRIKLAHVEAGLRSFNRKMPEEFNRKITDQLSDYLFTSDLKSADNLKNEGIKDNVFFTGNIMIDNLVYFLPKIKTTKEEFYFCTIHRAENIGDKKIFGGILNALSEISKDAKIYFPLHPHTKKMAIKFGLMKKIKEIFCLLPPINYQQSLYYQKNAKLVLTDSGGIQEESSFLGTPCLTLRTETERPITVEKGTNLVVGTKPNKIISIYKKNNFKKKKTKIAKWDGQTAKRIVKILLNS